MKNRRWLTNLGWVFILVFLAGCAQKSYPASHIKEALSEICRKEYGIEEMDVKIVGNTIGVYLPLKKLFAADFKEAAVTGKVRNLETLFEPSPEALEKVEDVLFSISRVILSTDRSFEFYVLEATDVEKTGMQLVLTGYVNDIKRVRIWDISRNEYRKRVIHELRLNRAVLWQRPVHQFFKDVTILSPEELKQKYFNKGVSPDVLGNLFLNSLTGSGKNGIKNSWHVTDMRSIAVQQGEGLVYVKLQAENGKKEPPFSELQYLFLVTLNDEQARIVRIIPFQYRDDQGGMQKIPFPKDLQIQENLEQWEQEFPLQEVQLGVFLAEQLTRRVQALSSADERIQNTFRDIKLHFEYKEDAAKPYFSLAIEASLKDFNHYNRTSLIFHEDMVYLLNIASREFVDVLRSYQFGDYEYLRLNVAQEASPWMIGREDLELFRRKKVDLSGLLTMPRI